MVAGSVTHLSVQHPNLLLWLQANSVPASFWATAFLLLPANQHYRQKVLASLRSPAETVSAPISGDSCIAASYPDVDGLQQHPQGHQSPEAAALPVADAMHQPGTSQSMQVIMRQCSESHYRANMSLLKIAAPA